MTGSWNVRPSIARSSGGRIFYEQRSAGSDNFDLMVRDANGAVRKLVDVAAIRAANGGEPFAINYFAPSNDGTKVAVGISQGGSENASLWVYDAATGAKIAGPVRTRSTAFPIGHRTIAVCFVNLLIPLKPGQPETDKIQIHQGLCLGPQERTRAGAWRGRFEAVSFKPDELPGVATFPGSPFAFAVNVNGVQNEVALWTAPVGDARSADAPWQHWQPQRRSHDIAVAGSRIFLLSHKDAPTFKVLALNAGRTDQRGKGGDSGCAPTA